MVSTITVDVNEDDNETMSWISAGQKGGCISFVAAQWAGDAARDQSTEASGRMIETLTGMVLKDALWMTNG